MAGQKDEIDLFREEDAVLMFYSKSAHKDAGKGASESISPTFQGDFAVLNAIPNWRQKLSNFSMRANNAV